MIVLSLLCGTLYTNAAPINKAVSESGKAGNYAYVDLGLKSGTKWATYNVGATQPTEYGDYFAWGETQPKEDYSWTTYKYEADYYKTMNNGRGSWKGCCKYTIADNQYESSGLENLVAWYNSDRVFIGDKKMTLEPSDDAATVNWGDEWRMPTSTEQQELIDGCDWEWTEDFNGTGIAGRIGTSKVNGNIIFLPAAGVRHDTSLNLTGNHGGYWSSSLFEITSYSADELYFYSDLVYMCGDYDRSYGRSVRAVLK